MATCANCQGAIADEAAICVYCGQTLKKRGWWKRVIDVLVGDRDLEHCLAGAQLQEQGRTEEAIEEFNKAIRLDPEMENAYILRASAYGEMGQYDKAFQDFDHAIRLDPLYRAIYDKRALAYTRLGMDTEAQEDVKRVEELGEDTVELRDLIDEMKGQRPDKTI